jgi:hypothetical protein
MKVALYARVSTERQAERGTIGSQLQVLREHVTAGGDELAGEYVDDGQSGARLDRRGLDALRDAAEAGLFELVWCLSPDRLARAYAYQVLVLDELARFGVTVRFTDAPDLAAGDPQATLLTQVQRVIAEYEKAPDDELLAAELTRLDRKIDATTAERRRLADLYQAGLIDLPELQRRSTEVTARQRNLQTKRDTLAAERTALTHGNLLRRRVTDFAQQIREVIDQLDRPQKQQLLRLLIEDVHVTGWQVKIRLRIPLDPPDPAQTRPGPARPAPSPTRPPAVSSQDRLRSVGEQDHRAVQQPVEHGGRDHRVVEDLSPGGDAEVTDGLARRRGPGHLPQQAIRAVRGRFGAIGTHRRVPPRSH